mgnify:CR=1 FL=1
MDLADVPALYRELFNPTSCILLVLALVVGVAVGWLRQR